MLSFELKCLIFLSAVVALSGCSILPSSSSDNTHGSSPHSSQNSGRQHNRDSQNGAPRENRSIFENILTALDVSPDGAGAINNLPAPGEWRLHLSTSEKGSVQKGLEGQVSLLVDLARATGHPQLFANSSSGAFSVDGLGIHKAHPVPGAWAVNAERGIVGVAWPDRLAVLSLLDGSELGAWREIKARATALQFTPDGSSLLAAGADGKIYRWKFMPGLERERRFERYIGPGTVVSALAVHPGGRLFFSGDWNGGLRVWMFYDANQNLVEFDRSVFGAAVFGRAAASVAVAGTLPVGIEKLLLSKDGARLLVGYQSGVLQIFNLRGMRLLGQVEAHRGLVNAVAWSADGTRIASSGRDGMLRQWTVWDKAGSATEPSRVEITAEGELPREATALVYGVDNQLWAGDSTGQVFKVEFPVDVKQ